jgi:hypothetical protein
LELVKTYPQGTVVRCRLTSVHCTREKGREVEYEWDPKKAERNLRKHGVEFVDAVVVFDDDRAITLPDSTREKSGI